MRILGITGSSGSGKSKFCEILSSYRKIEIIDADKVVRDLQDRKTEYYKKIVELFGKEILLENELINRKKLAEIIFSNEIEKQKLNKLTFNYVVNEIKRRIKLLENENLEYIVVDAPTLIEAGMINMFDKIVVLISSKENKINRICMRDNISKEMAEKRLLSQQRDEFYKAYADYVITNDDNNLEEKVRNFLENLER